MLIYIITNGLFFHSLIPTQWRPDIPRLSAIGLQSRKNRGLSKWVHLGAVLFAIWIHSTKLNWRNWNEIPNCLSRHGVVNVRLPFVRYIFSRIIVLISSLFRFHSVEVSLSVSLFFFLCLAFTAGAFHELLVSRLIDFYLWQGLGIRIVDIVLMSILFTIKIKVYICISR